ncbi:endo-1,4-beta-xylanase [candidate division KSB1 bacterium]|nr:endo-1,4-beta-xylanase [candidate division KSB1 bacterium]
MKNYQKSHTKYNGKFIIILTITLFTPMFLHAQADTVQTNVPALKDVYANDFTIGCLLSYRNIGFADDPPVAGQSRVITPNGGHLIKFHMNSMSPGNNMKPQYTVDINSSAAEYNAASPAERDSINTHPIVKFNGDMKAQLNWAQRQGFTFRGHTLIWHNQTPAAFFRKGYNSSATRLTKEQMIERMDNYIKEVIRLIHEGWPGLLSAMDVVNEAVNDGGDDRTNDSEWYLTFGDNSYLMKAFELTRKYTIEFNEPQIKLYYNDYNTHLPAKADGIVRICTPIFEAGYLDGIGMQDHDSNTSPTAEQWIASYNKFDPICTEMAVTELDVTTGYASPPASVLTTQANQYGQLFKCFVERSYYSGRGKIINVSKDGLNDQYTFKANQASSLWDAYNQCKPAFYAVVDVGTNYNALDSLLLSIDTLNESDYTIESWSNLVTAITLANCAMDQNYSATVSAADALNEAKETLVSAIEGLMMCTDVDVFVGNNPVSFSLEQNYPNPFNPVTHISYSIPYDGYVSLNVFDLLGEEVATIFNGFQPAGYYITQFDGSNLASGVYFYQVKMRQTIDGNENYLMATKKLNLLK